MDKPLQPEAETTTTENTTVAPSPNLEAVPAADGKNQDVAQQEKKKLNLFDGVVSDIRKATPAAVVNSGSNINLGLKAAADTMSVWSSVRKGSQAPYRLVASLITLGSETLGIFYKEKTISGDQEKNYKDMGLPKYVLTKTKEAFDPKNHILETNGLATILNGGFMAMSGISQSVHGKLSAEFWQGLMTTAAGLVMNYMPDRERAWQVAHGIFTVRAPVAGVQAYNAYFKGVPEKNIAKGDWQQAAKWVFNQASNVVAICYGGVKKLPDGSIIHIGKDASDFTPQRIKGGKQIVSARPDASAENNPAVQADERPATSISGAAVSHDLPERQQQQAEASTAPAVA